jgi:hypothetical protein
MVQIGMDGHRNPSVCKSSLSRRSGLQAESVRTALWRAIGVIAMPFALKLHASMERSMEQDHWRPGAALEEAFAFVWRGYS